MARSSARRQPRVSFPNFSPRVSRAPRIACLGFAGQGIGLGVEGSEVELVAAGEGLVYVRYTRNWLGVWLATSGCRSLSCVLVYWPTLGLPVQSIPRATGCQDDFGAWGTRESCPKLWA